MADISSSEVNENCALDMSTYENLPKPCNAPPLHSPTAIPIPKDHSDASYVFVTSTDATTTDHHAASDLNGDFTNPESILVQDELLNETHAIQDEITLADGHEETPVLGDQPINESFDALTNSGEIHGVEVEDILNHEENGIVKALDLSDTEPNPTGEIEVQSSHKPDDIQNYEENGIAKPFNLSITEANPRGEIEVKSSQKADIQNHEENGIVKAAPKLSNIEANHSSEIELENIELNGQNEIVDAIKSSAIMENRGQEGEVISEDNGTVAVNELSDTIDNHNEETEMESFEREEGIGESLDANLEAADYHCVDGKEKVDEMVNKFVISDPVGGMRESQIISMTAVNSELDHPNGSVEDVKGECESGVVLSEENSERTQIMISQDGEHYQVVGEEQESLNSEVSLLEPSEENKVVIEHHLAAAPSPLVNSEDVNGFISIITEDGLPAGTDQDGPLETTDDTDTVANGTSFHGQTETSSASVNCDIATVGLHKLSPTVLISVPKVELNENVNEHEVNHVLEQEENSETASHSKVDECVKVEVLEGTISENGDEMPTVLDESIISYGDDSVVGSPLIPEETEPVENIETAVSAVVIGNTSIEIREGSSTHCLNDPVLRSDLEVEVEDCTMSENVASAGNDVQQDKEVSENHEIGPLGNSNFETNCENGHTEKDNQSTFHSNDMRSDSNDCTSIVCEERSSIVPEVPTSVVNNSSAIQQRSAIETDLDLHDNECSSSPTANEKSGDDIEITSSIGGDSRNIPDDDCTVTKTEVVSNPTSDVVFETDSRPTKEVIEVIHEGCQNEPSPIPPKGSVDALAGQNVGAEAGTRPFNFLVKVPRFDDEHIREKIKCAQTEVDRKTKDRDAIRVQIQTMRVAWKVLSDNVEAAVTEGRAARDLLRSKRQEMDSVQSVITKVKNAMSVEDTDGRIRNIEHMIEHETLPLKEEKQLIREIKQLKQLREQLSATMGKQDELQQALDQKDQIEERLKLLRKEMDLLRDNVLKAESVTKAAKKKYNDESLKLDELQSQFRTADKIRQEAYANLQSMRKQLYEKNKYCWKYRDDSKEANEIASSGDLESLQRLCVNQVERMMELWNTNAEFREEYVKSNMRSTLRRLKTLDGRSLGPNEEPHVLNHIVKERPARDNSLSTVSTMREPEKLILADNARDTDDKPVTKVVETARNKKPDTVVAIVNGHRNISSENEVEEAPGPEEITRRREEEELAAKAEEMRKVAEAIKLKEQRKLEEKAKAKEALERKKRNAEKAHARAVTKARKEAEEREKVREKRAKRKERKMTGEMEAGNGWDERESTIIITETTPSEAAVPKEESENTGKQQAKRPQYTKQISKTKSIPPPLRNRGKRRMQPWMWVVLTTLVVLVVFLVGQQRLLY